MAPLLLPRSTKVHSMSPEHQTGTNKKNPDRNVTFTNTKTYHALTGHHNPAGKHPLVYRKISSTFAEAGTVNKLDLNCIIENASCTDRAGTNNGKRTVKNINIEMCLFNGSTFFKTAICKK